MAIFLLGAELSVVSSWVVPFGFISATLRGYRLYQARLGDIVFKIYNANFNKINTTNP
jgi:hypothetical protein